MSFKNRLDTFDGTRYYQFGDVSNKQMRALRSVRLKPNKYKYDEDDVFAMFVLASTLTLVIGVLPYFIIHAGTIASGDGFLTEACSRRILIVAAISYGIATLLSFFELAPSPKRQRTLDQLIENRIIIPFDDPLLKCLFDKSSSRDVVTLRVDQKSSRKFQDRTPEVNKRHYGKFPKVVKLLGQPTSQPQITDRNHQGGFVLTMRSEDLANYNSSIIDFVFDPVLRMLADELDSPLVDTVRKGKINRRIKQAALECAKTIDQLDEPRRAAEKQAQKEAEDAASHAAAVAQLERDEEVNLANSEVDFLLAQIDEI